MKEALRWKNKHMSCRSSLPPTAPLSCLISLRSREESGDGVRPETVAAIGRCLYVSGGKDLFLFRGLFSNLNDVSCPVVGGARRLHILAKRFVLSRRLFVANLSKVSFVEIEGLSLGPGQSGRTGHKSIC